MTAPAGTPSVADTLLSLRGITKNFGQGDVLRGIDLDVYRGEFLTLLGPSGCGKTTTLRIIAGLEQPDAGSVILDGQDVLPLPPEKRPVNTVFQNYALFPHMNVANNIAYGLKVRKASKAEIAARVGEMLDLVRLEGYEKRMPGQLSGGQRQRVAIARAVVLSPALLLLDEPLGALDLQLRRQMQVELKRLQEKLGITFIYITHDQEEALNMSDRIAVMNKGQFEQIGTPSDIYEHPATRFVAQFIGESNLLEATVSHADPSGLLTLTKDGQTMRVAAAPGAHKVGDACLLCIRTERLRFGDASPDGFTLTGTVLANHYAGSAMSTRIALVGGQEVIASGQVRMDDVPPVGTVVRLWFDPAQSSVVGGASGDR